MSGANAPFDCGEVDLSVDAYVDGEFTDADRGAIEGHLGACPACARKVRAHAAFKSQLKAAVPRSAAPEALRARVLVSLEGARVEPTGWRRIASRAVPAAAAAALLVGLMVEHARTPITHQLVDGYRQNLPLDVTGSVGNVERFLNENVPFAVRPPQPTDAALVGARVSSLGDRQAAYLVYQSGGRRVHMYVFDPADLPMEAHRRRDLGGRQVFFDRERGYNVAMVRSAGLGYAFASDLDEDHLVKFVSSVLGQ